MIKQADQVSLSQASPSHVADSETPGCVRAKVWLVVDKETLQPWSPQKQKIKLGKKHQSQTHMHLPPSILRLLTYLSFVVKAPECIHGSEICYLDSLYLLATSVMQLQSYPIQKKHNRFRYV
jgi:hypothetical protein